MPFHVEISSSFDRARVLNVEDTALNKEILEPWVTGLPFHFQGQDWQPRESRLTILEGPALEPRSEAEDGWDEVLRSSVDMTRRMLETAEEQAPARIALVVEGSSAEAALRDLGSGRPPRQIPWTAAVERVAGRDPDVSALILVVKRPEIDWPEL
jgi:hypothetical protein